MKFLYSIFLLSVFTVQGLKAQTPAELKAWLPEIEGWSISDKVETFDPDNLFDRINGAAPLFIENNFREMTAMEYTKGDDYITIQAYRHATPEDAFGMYSSERSTDLNYFPVGGEAQGGGSSFYFFTGNIYVKMSANSSDDLVRTLQVIADGFAKRIDADAGYPVILKAFPAEGKVPYSETYITSNYIGHDFLNKVFTAEYKEGNNKFQVFAINAETKEAAREILNKYFTFSKQSPEFQEGELTVEDRYNGDIPILWKGQYILGVYSEDGNQLSNTSTLLSKLESNLSK
jgi:hypothetical protein